MAFSAIKRSLTNASIEIPGKLTNFEITESGKVIAVVLNSTNTDQTNLNSIGYISGAKQYDEIVQFTFDSKQLEDLRRLKLNSPVEGIATDASDNLFLLTDNHVIQCPISAQHKWTRSTRTISRVIDIEATSVMPESLLRARPTWVHVSAGRGWK